MFHTARRKLVTPSLPHSSSPLLSSPQFPFTPNYVTRILVFVFLLLQMLICAPGLEAAVNPAVSSYARRTNSPHVTSPIWTERLRRSPLLPPTVTSFHSTRRGSPNKKKKEKLIRVSAAKVSVIPPMARGLSNPVGQSKSTKDFPHNDKRNSTSSSPSIASSASSLPRPPMVMQQSRKSTTSNVEREEISESAGMPTLPQNDQHSVSNVDQEYSQTLGERESINNKQTREKWLPPKIKEPQTPKTTEKKPKEKKIYSEFYEVLEAINKSIEDLDIILRQGNISLDDFLGFIDKGVTRYEILNYLKLSRENDTKNNRNNQNLKPTSNGNLFSKYKYDNDFRKGNHQKVLTDLPFTEIVHKVPVEREKTFDHSLISPAYNTDVEFLNHPFQSDFTQSDKDTHRKRSKKNEGKKTKRKYHKNKNGFQRDEKNLFLMDSDISTILPAKDSPMVLSFLPPKRKKESRDKDSASIINLTIEEIEKANKESMPIRSKVLSSSEAISQKNSNSDLTPQRIGNSVRSWEGSDRQQSNLRLVFPMKGIIMFCGILGIIAVITILILIIYGAVKCNKKPLSNSYQMSEHRELSIS